jgi:hypothetical protein
MPVREFIPTHVWDADPSVNRSLCGLKDPHPVISIATVEIIKDKSTICSDCMKKVPLAQRN